jgi:uncharacterized protein (TIGR03435 family)
VRRLVWSLLPFCAVISQPAPRPAFEVASVKPSRPSTGDLIDINLGTANHGVVTLGNVTLSECIRWAYGLVSEEQVTGPVWITDRLVRFDIAAKSQPDTSVEQLRAMMQTLLAERLGLVLHSQPKRLDHLELSVGKGGPKLAASQGDGPAFAPAYGRGKLAYSRITMHTLAVLLARQLKQMVIDKTGLTGTFDVNLEWTADDAGIAGVDIFSAVEQQLGLRLDMRKTPIEVLVVEHAEKVPRAN